MDAKVNMSAGKDRASTSGDPGTNILCESDSSGMKGEGEPRQNRNKSQGVPMWMTFLSVFNKTIGID
jgi:hypothetical protein